MQKIVLNNRSPSGAYLEATFLPEKGMNMISLKHNDLEIIDQSTKSLFEERFAGLGALIGPHFHHRKVLPQIKDDSLFPHIASLKAKGINEPFSHGIARYAPWQAEATSTSVKATISGKDTWNGVPLADLEGQNFKMIFTAELLEDGLHIQLSVVSETASLVGIHYYYHLPQGQGKIISAVKDTYIVNNQLQSIPSSFQRDSQNRLHLDLDNSIDYTFFPAPNPLEGRILLDAVTYQLLTSYSCASQENSWQLYHPVGSSFVCIEPVSSQDPRHPNLTASSINIHLQIITGDKG